MNKLFLFDIDGTLTSGFDEHLAAYEAAAKEVFGLSLNSREIIVKFDYHGLTDKMILSEVLRRSEVKGRDINNNLEKCFKIMGDFYENTQTSKVESLSGAKDLLSELRERQFSTGLVTGNIKKIAYSKLKQVGLSTFFNVGGFGDDTHAQRFELVNLAINRARRQCQDNPFKSVVVIGDTPRDIECGKKAGVKTIGVATGSFSEERLTLAGADYVFFNLTELQKKLDKIV